MEALNKITEENRELTIEFERLNKIVKMKKATERAVKRNLSLKKKIEELNKYMEERRINYIDNTALYPSLD